MIKKILTGCGCIDNHLNGGISTESLTLIYGEPETGKTTLAMQCAVNCAMQGYKTLYVDCDSTFSPKRLAQVAAGKFDEVAELIILMRPADFREQAAVIDRLSEYTARNFGLAVIDTFTSLYRIKVAEASGKAFELNRELNRQMAILAQTAKIQKIPVIVTSQVRSVFDEPQVSVEPVATRVLKFWADTIIAMKPTENPQEIKAVLEKTPETPQEVACNLTIDETGIHDSAFHDY
ncbi:AAA family ATPase [Candidatus Bathyarchaeota archaeon A05DMB-2]|nr:AAA family ATPase [Candidatus Bathyarchaeota archaeon A05DMB-2]